MNILSKEIDDYLTSNKILEFFLHNLPVWRLNAELCGDIDDLSEPFIWLSTPEGAAFWSYHNIKFNDKYYKQRNS